MSRIVKEATVGALGFDTVTPITSVAQAQALHGEGFDFAVRYLGGVTSQEIDLLHGGGLAVLPVTYSRKPGWQPNGTDGGQDGNNTVSRLIAAGFPKGTTVFFDLEGPGGHAQDVIDHVVAWAGIVRAAGFDPGLYVGYGTQLTSHELYALPVDRYWHSVSRVTDSAGQIAEPTCGWCMYQLNPSVWRAGFWVDVDVVQEDYQKRTPNWCIKSA